MTRDLCRALHDRGIKVQAKVLGAKWDKPEIWTKMIDAGVDWLQTDDPAGVRFTEARKRIPRFPVKISHHRGARRYAPENTLPAIQKAVDLEADYVEMDIRATKDGRFVLLHDRTLGRTTTGSGPVDGQLAEALGRLDAGSWFGKPFAGTRLPALDDALLALGGSCHAYLDAKDIPPAAPLAAIRRHSLMTRHVVYQSVDYCKKLRALDPAVRLLPGLRTLDSLDEMIKLRPYGVDARWTILSKEMIDRCHAAGIVVFADALGLHERVDEYRKAIAWGIDVIQTDYPLRVLRAIELEAVKPSR